MSDRRNPEPGCLHLVAADNSDTLRTCLSNCRPGDTLLVLDAGVLQLLAGADRLGESGALRICFLAADLQAQGLAATAGRAGFEAVDDSEFPALLRQHPHCVTWA